MIQEIRMAGIKGQNENQKLTGRDIIIGYNGSGKTTRMQAMSLAAFGYVPGKGKTAAETFELASDDTMTVGIVTDNAEIIREYKKTSKLTSDGTTDVKITQGITISPSAGERTIKDKEQRIREEIGNFPTMLDFGSFIELTDNGKRDFIYNLSGEGFSWDRARVESHLRSAVLREELERNNPEMYEVMQKNFDETMRQYSDKADVQSGLLAMTEHAKEQLSYWKKEKNTADAAARKLTELKNRGEETDRNLAENQEKLKAMDAEREEKIHELAKLQAQNRIITAKENELEKLKRDIASMEDNSQDEEILKDANVKIGIYAKEVIEAEDTIKKTRDEIESKRENVDDLVRRMQEKRAYITKLESERAVLKGNIKNITDLLQSITENAGYCAFSRDIPCSHDFSGFIQDKQNTIDETYDKIDQMDTNIQMEEEAYKEMDAELNSLNEDIKSAKRTINECSAKKRAAELNLESYKEIKQRIVNSAPILTAKQSQIGEIEAWLDENKKTELADIEADIEGLKTKIEALRTKIDEQKKIRNDIMNIKANIIDSQTATYEQECWSQIAEAIGQKGVQGEIVKEMLDPLRTAIDEKLHSMGLDKKFYFETESERGKEVFRFGWDTRGTRRPFNALSQGEQLLLLIAMMTTIIERNDPPVKILAIDNCNHLDHINMKRVIDGLTEAGKNMDNIILAGTMQLAPSDAPEWKVWDLTPEAYAW